LSGCPNIRGIVNARLLSTNGGFSVKLIILVFTILISSHSFSRTPLIEEAANIGINLSTKDKRLLEIGRIEQIPYIAGGILGTIPGFGIGHAIQGRWKDKGWIFTAGEAGGVGLMMAAGMSCMSGHSDMMSGGEEKACSSGNRAFAASGMLIYLGFKVWEIIDVWTAPPQHNIQYESIEERIKDHKALSVNSYAILPMVKKESHGLEIKINF
jgi:hypothetical protein